MKRIATLASLLIYVCLATSCAQRSEKPAAQRAAPQRPAVALKRGMTRADFDALLDKLLPGIGATGIAEREQPQREFEEVCFAASRPGYEAERTRLCQAMVARLGPTTAPPARMWLLRQLERIGGAESVPRLTELLDDPVMRIRELVRRALQKNPAPAAGEALARVLARAVDPADRVALINAVGARREKAAIPHLDRLAQDADPAVSAAAVAALGDIGGAEAVAALHPIWGGPDEQRRDWAAAAMLRIAEGLVSEGAADDAFSICWDVYLSSVPRHLRTAALGGIAAARPQAAIPLLFDEIREPADPRTQAQAVQLLGDLPGSAATGALVGTLPRVAPAAQVVILDTLAARGDAAGKPAVYESVLSDDVEVRVAALQALTQLGDASDVDLFATVAAHSEGVVRDAARAGLARLRGFSIEPAILIQFDEQEDEQVRTELLRGLAARHFKLAVPRLLGAAREPSTVVRAAAFDALGQLADVSHLPPLLDLLVAEADEETAEIAEEAVVAVCLRDDDRQRRAAPVIAALDDTQGAAGVPLIRVLGRIQGAAALTAVRAAMNDDDEQVVDAAVRAFSMWEDIVVLDDLLRLARETDNQTHHVLALRGYVRLVRAADDRSEEEKVRLLDTAMSATRRVEEQRLILGALSEVRYPLALNSAEQALRDPELAAEASLALVSIARNVAGLVPLEADRVLQLVLERHASDAAVEQAEAALQFIANHAGDFGLWLYAGPYSIEGKGFDDVFATALGPEVDFFKAFDPVQPLMATKADNPWVFELSQLSDCRCCCLYVMAGFESERQQPVRLAIGSDDGVKVWLNQELVHSNPAHRSVKRDEDIVDVVLKEGTNTLMLKIVNDGGGWGFTCGLRPAEGGSLQGIKLTPEG